MGDSTKSRTVTDGKLRDERDRADNEVLDRSTALGETADEVIAQARHRARLVLELARKREDDALDAADAGHDERVAVARARDTADALTVREYGEADAALFDERSQRRRAIIQLLALERDETDRTLASERHVADRLLIARDDLLGVVSHDLRSHLNSMLVRTSIVLMRSSQSAVVAEHLQALQRSIAQMDKLLTDLLDVAAMETGRMRVDCVPADLGDVVAQEVAVHRPTAEARSIHLSLDVLRAPIIAKIDPERTSRPLMNVLTNAIKFTPEGGRIDVAVERGANEACISVKDTGPGIAADQLESVFERFRRADSSARGYGLGLYIARSIINAQGGRIWVESTLGDGSTFHIRLPLSDT